LTDYLTDEVFAGAALVSIEPDPADVAGFDSFMQRYVAGLPVQQSAVAHT
jgi:hypothetical protein